MSSRRRDDFTLASTAVILVAYVLLLNGDLCSGFTTTASTRKALLLSSSRPTNLQHSTKEKASLLRLASSSKDDGNNNDEERRMEMVRQLQKSFYQTSTTEEERPQLEASTGRMLHVPLWRVGWVEVPGRANVLNVHEGHYTNMFEKILAGPREDWYFGHLYLPGGTKAARTGETRFALKTWQEEAQDDNRFDETERSAVIGSLMRITDYRRLKDGRLVILVHPLERFVVDTVVQDFPHGVAHVQILPDADQYAVPDGADENFSKAKRATAVAQSFAYHNYECDPVLLPITQDTEYMSPQDIFGVQIAQCLPFAFFAKEDSMLPELNDDDDKVASDNDNAFAGGSPRLEDLLQRDLMLRNPPPLPAIKSQADQSTDALEKYLWLALDDFCRATNFAIPDAILSLRPRRMDCLDLPEPINGYLSKNYPASRRQWRLSYHVAALLEQTTTDGGMSLRQMLLNAPTTQARLAAVLERFQAINEALMGEFE